MNNAIAKVQIAKRDTTQMPAQPTSATSGGQLTTFSNGVTARWGGSYNATTKVWTLKSIGSVPNPTGPTASALTRTITETMTLTPPPYSFVALNTSCDNHTLLVETGGDLTVTNAMYVNSCNSPSDAFDIFGTGGNISDPAGIKVVGGWETHNGSTVTANGTLCPLSNSSAPITATQPAGCPVTGQPVLADPLASVSAPALGSPACTTNSYGTAVAYSPNQTIVGGITASQTTITSSGTAVLTGDIIQIDTEQMLVTAGGGTATLTVQRGYLGTTAATHTSGKVIKKVPVTVLGAVANPAPCLYQSGNVTLNPGTYYGGICIGSASTANCDAANCSTATTTGAYSPAVTLNGGITATVTSIPVHWSGTTTPDPISTGDIILVESEQMLVTNAPATNGSATLTVTRAYAGTTAASHASGKAVTQVTTSNVSATLNPGTYIMAGGGFRVCGASNLSAPNVMIYNTQDPTSPTGQGALDQFELNTTGNVSLGPQTSGAYQGLTIFQDQSLALDTTDSCNTRNNVTTPTQTQINEYDIALMSMASTGANGALGSISGSLYAPANRSDFADEVSGTANLAVLASCIVINGSTSTFAFDPSGLFGTGWVLGPQGG
jgi:hypothetical protein